MGPRPNIFLALAERLEQCNPPILEAFAQLLHWVDPTLLLNGGFVNSVPNLLAVDQTSPDILSILVESARIVGWGESEYCPLFELIQNPHWLRELNQKYGVEYPKPRFQELVQSCREGCEAAMISNLEQFLLNPILVPNLVDMWKLADESGCHHYVEIAASIIAQ
jgi:hypothetical protein